MKADLIWENVACDEGPSEVLARELGVSPVTARLLCIRGLGNLDDARRSSGAMPAGRWRPPKRCG